MSFQHIGPDGGSDYHRWTVTPSLPNGKTTADKVLDAILRSVALDHDLDPEDLKGHCRWRVYAWPRQEFMARAYATGRYSLQTIATFLNGRDWTTVRHGVRAHTRRVWDL